MLTSISSLTCPARLAKSHTCFPPSARRRNDLLADLDLNSSSDRANTEIARPAWQAPLSRPILSRMTPVVGKRHATRSAYAGLDFIKAAFCPLDFNAIRFADRPDYRQWCKDDALAQLEVGEPLQYPRQFPYTDRSGKLAIHPGCHDHDLGQQ